VKLFFSSFYKDISWDEAEKKKLIAALSHFSFLTMHEVVGEAILPNTSSKIQLNFI